MLDTPMQNFRSKYEGYIPIALASYCNKISTQTSFFWGSLFQYKASFLYAEPITCDKLWALCMGHKTNIRTFKWLLSSSNYGVQWEQDSTKGAQLQPDMRKGFSQSRSIPKDITTPKKRFNVAGRRVGRRDSMKNTCWMVPNTWFSVQEYTSAAS